MEQLVNFIIRPPRSEYDPKHDLLEQEFMLRGKWYQRKDIEIKNDRGEVLQCSHYVPIVTPEGKPLPCVIYCHGNSGCRADASEAAIILLPSNITVFALDFSGSGLSGGEHVTLGWNEKNDLRAAVDYLRQDGTVSLIGLWGRSMGAVTSLMYGAEDPSIAGMVLDSPFSDLVDLMMELVDAYKIRLPKFTVKFAIQYMRRAIQKKAKFDIMELNTIKVAKSCFVPALFGHAIDDDFIHPHHSDRIYEAYVGDKNIIKFEGDHNSPRPQFYFDSINIFFHNVLQPPEDEVGSTFFGMGHDYLGKDSWSNLCEMEYNTDSLAASKEPSTSGTAQAIKQVRLKRPMSRTEVPSDIAFTDKPSEALDEESSDNKKPSSTGMISFELSNGHPYGPQVPMTMDDDEFVEYELEDLAGFPCNVEEEDQMLMEAIILSLKDLETQQPSMLEELATLKPASVESSQSSPAKELPAAPSMVEDSATLKPASVESSQSSPTKELPAAASASPTLVDSPSSSTEHYSPTLGKPLNMESASVLTTNCQYSAIENQVPSTTLSPVGPTADTPLSIVESDVISPPPGDASKSNHNSTDADLSGNTKATLTVERNPATNVRDGLLRRWDFNFFRTNR